MLEWLKRMLGCPRRKKSMDKYSWLVSLGNEYLDAREALYLYYLDYSKKYPELIDPLPMTRPFVSSSEELELESNRIQRRVEAERKAKREEGDLIADLLTRADRVASGVASVGLCYEFTWKNGSRYRIGFGAAAEVLTANNRWVPLPSRSDSIRMEAYNAVGMVGITND